MEEGTTHEPESSAYQTREEPLFASIVDLPDCRTVRHKLPLIINYRVHYFVVAAQQPQMMAMTVCAARAAETLPDAPTAAEPALQTTHLRRHHPQL